jgi:hypothetical protein
MCDSFECETYATLFRERVRKQRTSVALLFSLALLSLFIGISLITLALIVGDLKNSPLAEGIKTGLGLVVSGISVVTWKEVLDRWVGLVPFTNLNDRLARCNSLPAQELEVTCALAKAFLPKL